MAATGDPTAGDDKPVGTSRIAEVRLVSATRLLAREVIEGGADVVEGCTRIWRALSTLKRRLTK